MATLSRAQVNHIFTQLKSKLKTGNVSLASYLDTIRRVILRLSPKEDQKYQHEYQKDKYSVGGLKPLPIPKNIAAFYRAVKIYFDPIKQLYFFGRPHKRSHGKLVRYRDLPKITIRSRQFIQKRFF